MKQVTSFVLVGLCLLPPRYVVADVSTPGTVATPESQPNIAPQIESAELKNEQSPPSSSESSRFSAGVRFGFFPPVLTALEIALRPGDYIAMSAYGIFLGGDGARVLIAASLTAELAGGGRSGWYLSTGFLHFNQSRNSRGFYETASFVPLTGGYLFRSGWFELQLGAGAQLVLADDTPPCTGWVCWRFNAPYPLPAVDLALRYRF